MRSKFQPIAISDLETVSGGMKWEDFRRSANVVDRRSDAAKRRDQDYFNQLGQQPAQR